MRLFILSIGFILLISSCKKEAFVSPMDRPVTEEIQAKSNIIWMASTDWPPYYSRKLKNGGPVTEVTREALRRAGYELKMMWIPWARAEAKTVDGDYHALLGCFKNIERGKTMIFSRPIGKSEFFLVSHKEKKIKYTELRDLSPYVIASLRGYKVNKEFDEAPYLEKRIVETVKQSLGMLKKKRVDLIYEDKMVLINEAKRWYPDLLDQIEYLEPPLASKEIYIGFSKKVKGIQQIVKEFNARIKEMKSDGTYKGIYNSHGYQI